MGFSIKKIFDSKKSDAVCSVVIVAAGSSSRMGTDKLFLKIKDTPVIIYSLKAFEKSPFIKEIIIVTQQEKIDEIRKLCKQYSITKLSNIVVGGDTRVHSSYNGVIVASSDSNYIAVHDAARPFVSQDLIAALVKAAEKKHAAVPGVISHDTVKLVKNGFVQSTTDRNSTVLVQTPQVFDSDILVGALSNAIKNNVSITDDSSAVEVLGFSTYVVEGYSENIKLTDKADYRHAISIAEYWSED